MNKTLREIFQICKAAEDYFEELGIDTADGAYTAREALEAVSDRWLRDIGRTREEILTELKLLLEEENEKPLIEDFSESVSSFTVYGGFDKDRKPENLEVTFHKGDCVCVCGKTGSGKTRLLEDIQYLAFGDSPSGRKIRINGKKLTEELRLELENRFCACLSQSMNFVMELSCRDFLFQHASSRKIVCTEEMMEKILSCANSLAGEPLHPEDMITALSGGQSRALMIADIAFLSAAPVVLIDEPENAGIDKDAIIKLLAEKGKIVLISTHDPILALSCEKRIFIENGGIRGVLMRTEEEAVLLEELKSQEQRFKEIRNQIRGGKRIGAI